MGNFLGEYSNGWGHLIMSVCSIACFSALLIFHAINVDIFAAIISPIVLFWFGAGIANTAIRSSQQQTHLVDKQVAAIEAIKANDGAYQSQQPPAS